MSFTEYHWLFILIHQQNNNIRLFFCLYNWEFNSDYLNMKTPLNKLFTHKIWCH